jgi:BlaI family transcriptional regulator, penicillinase repressor
MEDAWMTGGAHQDLSRRERQIMDVVYRRGQVTVSEVREELPDPPSYSAVRAMLRRLEDKGHVAHSEEGARYVYEATVPRDSASETALERVLRTFFDDSPSKTVAALLDLRGEDLSDRELDELADLIDRARGRGR